MSCVRHKRGFVLKVSAKVQNKNEKVQELEGENVAFLVTSKKFFL